MKKRLFAKDSNDAIYCIAHAQYHQSQDLRNGGRRPTFFPHFNGHLLTFQDILECLPVYQYRHIASSDRIKVAAVKLDRK